jgi:hypothetical protein
LPEGVKFENGGYVYLSSLMSLPEGVKFENGGYVYLSSLKKGKPKKYVEKFHVTIHDGCAILYKRVSKEFKTQEGKPNETLWMVGSVLSHPSYNPNKEECGEGKFHAVARPYWGTAFRMKKDDKFIALSVPIEEKLNGHPNLYEWPKPSYPAKIAFGKCTVLYECDKYGKRLGGLNAAEGER